MASINYGAVEGMVKNWANSSGANAKLSAEALANGIGGNPDEAAQAFIKQLEDSIRGSGLSADAISSLLGIGLSYEIIGDNGKGLVNVVVQWSGDTFRASLAPETFGGISDIVELLNDGASIGGRVYGMWPGHYETWNKTTFEAAHFIESAISSFDKAKYHVVSIGRI